MKIKTLISSIALVLATNAAQAEIQKFEAVAINNSNHFFYPNLNLDGLNEINISVDKQIEEGHPMPNFDIKRVEFNFPNANNLVASNFTKVPDMPDTYRAIVTSPWVFKKVMIELRSFDFFDTTHFNYQVKVIESTSHINNLEQSEGVDLFMGDAELNNITNAKVVDVVRTRYLDKPLTLRLLNQAGLNGINIEAIWMGHGTKILTIPFPVYPEQKPVSLSLTTVFDDQFIKVRLDNAYHGPETPDESLRNLLEQAFGPLPYPEPVMP